jgi:hypothetical protein
MVVVKPTGQVLRRQGADSHLHSIEAGGTQLLESNPNFAHLQEHVLLSFQSCSCDRPSHETSSYRCLTMVGFLTLD